MLNIISTLLSLINVTKHLPFFILQNMPLWQCYLSTDRLPDFTRRPYQTICGPIQWTMYMGNMPFFSNLISVPRASGFGEPYDILSNKSAQWLLKKTNFWGANILYLCYSDFFLHLLISRPIKKTFNWLERGNIYFMSSIGEGMDEMEFTEAESNMNDLVTSWICRWQNWIQIKMHRWVSISSIRTHLQRTSSSTRTRWPSSKR